jgi:hypothetical protein
VRGRARFAGAGGQVIRAMHFGHNSNVRVGDVLFHVQTEDRGFQHPFIDTTVYSEGRVLHRRTTSYYDLLEMDGNREEILQKRVEEQHRNVIEEIRAGTLKLAPAPLAHPPSAKQAFASPRAAQAAHAAGLRLELLNPTSWFSAGKATLTLRVTAKGSDAPLEGIHVEARVEGAVVPTAHAGTTGSNGEVELSFAMPRMGSEGGALVIHAAGEAGQDELRYQLRAKPKTPAPADAR